MYAFLFMLIFTCLCFLSCNQLVAVGFVCHRWKKFCKYEVSAIVFLQMTCKLAKILKFKTKRKVIEIILPEVEQWELWNCNDDE